jgi:heme-degrading monooxygenase HmoA
MHARMTTVEGQPDSIDDAVSQVNDEVLPLLEQQAGFKGFTLHVDRSSGKVVGTSYWDSQEAMDASEDAVRGPREEAARRGGASGGPAVDYFEVVIDTMAR